MEICFKCKKEKDELHNHHVVPRSEGGSDEPENIIRICSDCHFKTHYPNKEDGDIEQFNPEFKAAMEQNIFGDGWGIIPRKVMYDSSLTHFAKLLYCELSSLCAERGYCWATNQYLATKFNVDVKSVSRSITMLEKYLVIEDRLSAKRRIFIHTLNMDKNVFKHRQKSPSNIDKKVPDSIYNNISNKINKNKVRAPKDFFLNDFEDVWAIYPRKVGKVGARKAWEKIKMTAELVAQIKQSVEAHKKTDQWRESPKYIPHFATFLNQERWTDEVEVGELQQEAIVI